MSDDQDQDWCEWVSFFWYRPTRVVPDQRPLNGCVCVSVSVCLRQTMRLAHWSVCPSQVAPMTSTPTTQSIVCVCVCVTIADQMHLICANCDRKHLENSKIWLENYWNFFI